MTLGRKPSLTPMRTLHTKLPETQLTQLDLSLWSDLDNRVPHGAYQRFFSERIREFFSWKRVDLHPFGFPSGFFITGPKEMVEAVVARLSSTPLPTAQGERNV